MDISLDNTYVTDITDTPTLSYDDTISYDEQVSAANAKAEEERSSLAKRIGTTKVYLISEAVSGAARTGKRKHDEQEDVEDEAEQEMAEGTGSTPFPFPTASPLLTWKNTDTDSGYRDNAILFQGPPISHLPTSNLFAYATHFDSHPIALEWIDDTTCILVFPTRSAARTAHRHLSKSPTEEPSEEGYLTAKPIPIALWPPEERINKSLGMGEGLKGLIRMRWATGLDVKKRGAKSRSQFYRKYGKDAGKDDAETGREAGREQKRRRKDRGEINETLERVQLDDELDAFLKEDGDAPPTPEPLSARIGAVSKMRSDHMAEEGKSLLERTSDLRAHPSGRPYKGRGSREPRDFGDHDRDSWRVPRRERRGGRNERPRVTQEDLDAELDAFLQSKE